MTATSSKPITASDHATDRVPLPSARASSPTSEQLDAERVRLIELCLYAVDRARSTAVAQRLIDGLSEVGVSVLRPVGEVFDPARHEAFGTVRTEDPARAGTIAGTELPGFADRDRVLRAPLVTVYQQCADGPAVR